MGLVGALSPAAVLDVRLEPAGAFAHGRKGRAAAPSPAARSVSGRCCSRLRSRSHEVPLQEGCQRSLAESSPIKFSNLISLAGPMALTKKKKNAGGLFRARHLAPSFGELYGCVSFGVPQEKELSKVWVRERVAGQVDQINLHQDEEMMVCWWPCLSQCACRLCRA